MLRTVLSFIGTWNAGSTAAGEAYIARWPDQFGNLCSKPIPRPEVVSRYFKDSDAVDKHNKSRQGDLALEEHWRTVDCWLKLGITFLGLTVTNCWKSARHHCSEASGFPEMAIKDFTESLVYDLWNKPYGEEKKRKKALVLGCNDDDDDDEYAIYRQSAPAIVTPTAQVSDAIKNAHVRVNTSRRQKLRIGKTELLRRKCRIKAEGCCSRGGSRTKTSWECGHPACMKNGFKANSNITEGVFICKNALCLTTHHQMVQLEEGRTFGDR